MNRYLKILFIVVLCAVSFTAEAKSYRVKEIQNVQRQDRTRFVSNPDGILSRRAVATLDSICYSLKEQGIAEVAIVVVDDIKPRDMVSFSQDLFEGWGVGDDKLDNGLGILLVRDMREVRFHTGYGIEGVLPDALCVQIQHDYMLPYFREGDYSAGMVEGLRAVNTVLTGGDLPKADREEGSTTFAMIMALLLTMILIVPIILVYRAERARIKCPLCGKHKLRTIESVVVEQTSTHVTVEERLVCDNCKTKYTRTTRKDRNNRGGGGGIIFFPMGGFGGGRGGGFGGGGFGGGFGGGSFGGGGGGSRW